MSPNTQPLPIINNRVVRLAQEGGPCHIAGGIESETRTTFRTIKTYGGFFIRKRIAKSLAHTEPCDFCPSRSDITERWLQPGIDPDAEGH